MSRKRSLQPYPITDKSIMSDITTKELAIKLNCSQESVRVAKAKHKDKFTDAHVYLVDGCNYWTNAGQTLIAELLTKQGFNDTVNSGNDIVNDTLELVEDAIADLLADDAIPQIEPLINLDRIKAKAIKLTAQRIAAKLKAERLEHWQLVTENLTFSPVGVAGNLPSSEVSHAAN